MVHTRTYFGASLASASKKNLYPSSNHSLQQYNDCSETPEVHLAK